jgi:hypothetical protein
LKGPGVSGAGVWEAQRCPVGTLMHADRLLRAKYAAARYFWATWTDECARPYMGGTGISAVVWLLFHYRLLLRWDRGHHGYG